jgi:hypothetical protein
VATGESAAADQMPLRRLVAELGQLRFEQAPLELALEYKSVERPALAIEFPFGIEQPGHAVDPNPPCAQPFS